MSISGSVVLYPTDAQPLPGGPAAAVRAILAALEGCNVVRGGTAAQDDRATFAVPPTAGLVAKFFGVGHLATLFGVVMLTHQVGGFLGAWLGGQVFQATGSFDIVWMIDIGLAVAAALIHLPIREATVVRVRSTA